MASRNQPRFRAMAGCFCVAPRQVFLSSPSRHIASTTVRDSAIRSIPDYLKKFLHVMASTALFCDIFDKTIVVSLQLALINMD